MDTPDCAVCQSPGNNREATTEEVAAFWHSRGVDGAIPKGLEVRALIRCTKRLYMPHRELCDCTTAWVRNSPQEAWRPIVQIPADFVATVSV